jgi:hypothetical protein
MNIKLLEKKRRNGDTSLFMSYCINGMRKTEDLHIILKGKDKDGKPNREDDDRRLLAKFICAKREWEIIARENNVEEPYPHNPPTLLLSIVQRFAAQYTSKDIKVVLAMQKKLTAYIGKQ